MTQLFAEADCRRQEAGSGLLPVYESVEAALADHDGERPVPLFYPEALDRAAHAFVGAFRGDVVYAVKSNPDPVVLSRLAHAGVTRFDVASTAEVELVQRSVPAAELAFMHPVKPRSAIARAYAAGVRTFALDSAAELAKIEAATGGARDLTLFVRLGCDQGSAAYALDTKFGIAGAEAVDLVARTARAARRLGLTFHVGSQCMEPQAYARAVAMAADVAAQAGVRVDALDVGGGFPAPYPGMTPPPLAAYMAAIHGAVDAHGLGPADLACEPGRALVAAAGSVLARVELRKGDRLYLNDGTYGSLFDAGRTVGWRFPTRLVGRASAAAARPFSFFGPTCDSLDAMAGPFYLPDDVDEGDWIEIGQLGAYGTALRTAFNGFTAEALVAVDARAHAAGHPDRPAAEPFRAALPQGAPQNAPQTAPQSAALPAVAAE
ncbi:hypothetical protein CCR80_01870 [Rhodothalassium salexigens]|uniref:hypothetical protein n=1 Tax=Rhodothalassium salexigens TaxID=1086 RepID=UPI001914584D|nr:hypothetical protein [Rhodothalassium salexigens]MBK5919784.1 hypothetical protein [Rhodothalassium salexigens]